MAATHRQRFLSHLVSGEDALTADFADLSARIRELLLAAADRDGNIPASKWRALEQQIRALIVAYFISAHSQGSYTVDHNGDLSPVSAFARRLWTAVTTATALGVRQQASILRRELASAPDLVRQLENATVNPFLAFDLLVPEAQDAYRAFVPQYDVTWNDNRTLGDRILATASTTQAKVGALTRELLAAQTPAKTVADTLNRFLTESLAVRNKSYGTRAVFDASRLLATETALAYNRASVYSALLNPFIVEAEVFVSASHKGQDSCDDVVAGNPYSIKEVPIPPFHAFCACGVRYIVNGKTQTVISGLRGNADRLNIRGALSPGFANLLLRGGGVHAGN